MISNIGQLIKALNKQCLNIVGKEFVFDMNKSLSYGNRLKYNTHGGKKAISRRKEASSEVNVCKFLNNYYIYSEADFAFASQLPKGKRKASNEIVACSISISVFKEMDSAMLQLFRAEWAEYGENEKEHPQPHWHFTATQFTAKNFKTFVDNVADEGFEKYLKGGDQLLPPIERIHFPMKAKWSERGTDVSSMDSIEQVEKWFAGLLASIKKEIRFVENK